MVEYTQYPPDRIIMGGLPAFAILITQHYAADMMSPLRTALLQASVVAGCKLQR
jgi:hypothetical protein